MKSQAFTVFYCIIFYCSGVFGETASVPTKSDEDDAIQRILQLIQQLANDQSIRNPAAKLVRLSFHDCMGGCDGCLNMNNDDNNGLQEIYAVINTIYDTEGYNSSMSRADFIALSGTVAIRQASSLQSCQRLGLPPGCVIPTPNITIKYGRTDCPSSPNTDTLITFPNPHGDLDHVLSIFRDQMNMTVREVVAILGAHTLGAANIRNSGFRGPWVPATDVFDNMFYRLLINPDWFQEEINDTNSPVFPDSRWQWTLNRPGPPGPGGPPRMLLMLNTDVAILKSIQPDDNGEEMNSTCQQRLGDCEPSETVDIVTEFANDNNAFHEAFDGAYQILVENGYQPNSLSVAFEGTPTPATNTSTEDPTSGSAAVSSLMMAPFILMSMLVLIFMY